MAITEEIILKVEKAAESANTIKELRKALADAKKAMSEAQIDSTEYNRALDATRVAQTRLSDATKIGKKEIEYADGSYNALSQTLSKLKKEYKETGDEVKRAEIAKQIAPIDKELKKLDADVGVFGRNVGDYANQMAGAFQQTAGVAGSVVAPLQRVNGVLNVLKAHPVIAILGLISSLIYGVANSAKAGEEGTRRWTVALAAFKPIGDFFTKLLHQMQKELTWVVEKVGQFAQWIGILGDKSKEYQRIAEEEIAIEQERRELLEEEAKIQKAIAKLRAEAADKRNVSGAEAVKLLEKATALEHALEADKLAFAKREAELITAKNALMPSSTEELNDEAEALRKVDEIETSVLNKMRKYNSQLYEADNRAKKLAEEEKKHLEFIERKKSEQLEIDMFNAEREAEEEWLTAVEEDYYRLEAATEEHLSNVEKRFEDQQKKILDTTSKGALEQAKILGDQYKAEKDLEEAKMAVKTKGLALASSIADSAADIIGKETKAGKAMAIASTTISTYQSATEAFKSMSGIPIVGPALGAAAAAAAVASGLANVKSILSVKTDGSTASMANVPNSAVQTYAPATVQQVAVTRSLTGASEEQRLNDIVSGVNKTVKAYVVSSEMEGQMLADKQVQDESSF